MISVLHLGQALYMCRVPARQEASARDHPFKCRALETERAGMKSRPVDAERIRIPRWTIWRQSDPLGCPHCGSMIVSIKADARQVSFCECRMIEDRQAASTRKRTRQAGEHHDKNE